MLPDAWDDHDWPVPIAHGHRPKCDPAGLAVRHAQGRGADSAAPEEGRLRHARRRKVAPRVLRRALLPALSRLRLLLRVPQRRRGLLAAHPCRRRLLWPRLQERLRHRRPAAFPQLLVGSLLLGHLRPGGRADRHSPRRHGSQSHPRYSCTSRSSRCTPRCKHQRATSRSTRR